MRRSVLALAILLLAASAQAQVQLMIGRDGKKVIYNVASGSTSKHDGDLKWLAKQRNRSSAYDAIIEHYANAYGVDPVLVRAVIQVESNFNPNCVSNKGARGLMQLMPETAKRFGVGRIHDPDENIRGGVKYLSALMGMFPNDLPRALAAYNAGEGAVLKYAGIPPYEETTMYVKRALTVYYGQPYGQGGTSFGGGHGKLLAGGFGRAVVTPLADAVFPRMRYLGTTR